MGVISKRGVSVRSGVYVETPVPEATRKRDLRRAARFGAVAAVMVWAAGALWIDDGAGAILDWLAERPTTVVAQAPETDWVALGLDPTPTAAIGSARLDRVRPIRASWKRDFEACVKHLTRGGHFRKSSGIVRYAIMGGVSERDGELLEPRLVACMAEQKPGKFCANEYREAFVSFARSPARKAGLPKTDPEFSAITRGALSRVIGSGVVRARDFLSLKEMRISLRQLRVRGARSVPPLVSAISRAHNAPPRPC